MSEQETIFSSNVKYNGIFSFPDFYRFCYDWLREEKAIDILENKYSEKLSGNAKNIDITWTTTKEVTDYFKFEIKVDFEITNLTEVEVVRENVKIKTNKGSVKLKVKGTLIRDYKGKFEKSGFLKFLREIYEKWVITSRIEEFKTKLFGDCDEFLSQSKAYLDLEGKR